MVRRFGCVLVCMSCCGIDLFGLVSFGGCLGAGGGFGGYEVWFGRFAPVGVLLCFVGYGISMLLADCWAWLGWVGF